MIITFLLSTVWVNKRSLRNPGVADCGMKNNFALFQNPCRDVAIASLYIQIHTSIQQHRNPLP
ncbi:hypothetical protein [Nostoc sp. DedQUE03]|uniref:hypothetical protein n=1 Tax=Nostoc sp. DedQUE03 TaxID=3075389 RepID=UPI002AD448EE|nr:hypothetical protein [Nostoc sp. DedQUE03]MDZ7976149.1 hypothetical protein [Nostoc sp. DedQUE03]MDZ8044125.1 hypothetical protein [Nostoc sp. DedQUE02]